MKGGKNKMPNRTTKTNCMAVDNIIKKYSNKVNILIGTAKKHRNGTAGNSRKRKRIINWLMKSEIN